MKILPVGDLFVWRRGPRGRNQNEKSSTHFVVRFPLPAFAFAKAMANLGSISEAAEKIITIEPGKRGGRPCIRGMRITVGDILGWLAAGMNFPEILADYPDLTEEDIRAALSFAAERETRSHPVSA